MADNINVTADADYNVSADEVTASSPARHVQRIKIAQSADGSSTARTTTRNVPEEG